MVNAQRFAYDADKQRSTVAPTWMLPGNKASVERICVQNFS